MDEGGWFELDLSQEGKDCPFVIYRVLMASLLAAALGAATGWGADPERSVIQIMTFSQPPVFDAPWRFEPVRRNGGSGFVIKGKRIMTNAHVVSWARQIIVRRYQDPKPYVAEIEFVGHECDLAILKVADDSFFQNLEALEFGELPKVRSTVVTYGYPAGGEEISYTRGVVSRIEVSAYAHIGNRQFLTVQTDAAINPGNSGGPVIQDDRVVGVAFQGMGGLENTGFFIPPPVIQHLLKDIEDGKYDGFPQAGVRTIELQNPAYREFLKVPDNNLGARIDKLHQVPSTLKLLKQDDVVFKIGPYPVASDGTILFENNRVSVGMAFHQAQHGESVPLQIWRDGKPMEISLPVQVQTFEKAQGYQYDALPKYYVYGGLVFTPLSMDYLRSLGRDASDPAAAGLYYELRYRRYEEPEKARSEPVVLASILADAVNANLTSRGRELVNEINGIRIERMEDVIAAFEKNTGDFHVIKFLPQDHEESLKRTEVSEANARILKTYGVTNDRRL